MKPRRRKLIREDLEASLAKYSRRIQKLSENAYKVRQLLAQLDVIPVQKPLTKADIEAADKVKEEEENAVHKTGEESSPSAESTDGGTGGSDLSVPTVDSPVLGE